METLDIIVASKHPNYRHDKFCAKIQYLLVWFKQVIYVITYNVNRQISRIASFSISKGENKQVRVVCFL